MNESRSSGFGLVAGQEKGSIKEEERLDHLFSANYQKQQDTSLSPLTDTQSTNNTHTTTTTTTTESKLLVHRY